MATSSSSPGSAPLLSSCRDKRFIAFVPSGEYPLIPRRRQLVRQALGEYVWQVPHGAMPIAKVVLVAVSRGRGHIGNAAVVRAAKSVRHCRQFIARVLRETAANVPGRLVEVGGRRVTGPRVWRVRYRSDLHFDVSSQGKEGLGVTLMIAHEVLPGLLGGGSALGWSSSVGARCGLPRSDEHTS